VHEQAGLSDQLLDRSHVRQRAGRTELLHLRLRRTFFAALQPAPRSEDRAGRYEDQRGNPASCGGRFRLSSHPSRNTGRSIGRRVAPPINDATSTIAPCPQKLTAAPTRTATVSIIAQCSQPGLGWGRRGRGDHWLLRNLRYLYHGLSVGGLARRVADSVERDLGSLETALGSCFTPAQRNAFSKASTLP
jgi:hypothetical protein